MPLTFNLHRLESKNLRLQGELSVAELDLDSRDEMVRAAQPLHYELELQQMEDAVLAQGTLELKLDCQCVRCLKAFQTTLKLESWACHIPLSGDDKALVINDSVDLTPYLREDIFLAFPQHPLCKQDCRGLFPKKTKAGSGVDRPDDGASPWAALDKLKLK
jgi:uncharacterized protein